MYRSQSVGVHKHAFSQSINCCLNRAVVPVTETARNSIAIGYKLIVATWTIDLVILEHNRLRITWDCSSYFFLLSFSSFTNGILVYTISRKAVVANRRAVNPGCWPAMGRLKLVTFTFKSKDLIRLIIAGLRRLAFCWDVTHQKCSCWQIKMFEVKITLTEAEMLPLSQNSQIRGRIREEDVRRSSPSFCWWPDLDLWGPRLILLLCSWHFFYELWIIEFVKAYYFQGTWAPLM